MRPTGYEPNLVKDQLKKHASIFACDEYAVYSDGAKAYLGESSGGKVETTVIPHADAGKGNPGQNSWQTTPSWLNTLTFMHAWNNVLKDGRYRSHDWVVKVDPDAVFFPDRLRNVLRPHTKAEGSNVYIQNCNAQNHIHLQGSMEVFSRQAIENYGANHWKCEQQLPWHGWGEDMYMQKCMNTLGVGKVAEFNIFYDINCVQGSCADKSRVSYHPYKETWKYWDCWRQSGGK